MSVWLTVSELRMYLDQVPIGTEQDAVLQLVLDRAEATIAAQLLGVVIEAPAPDDLKQVTAELASTYYLTRGTASRLETAGADEQGGFEYVGGLTGEQKAALRQIRIAGDAVAF